MSKESWQAISPNDDYSKWIERTTEDHKEFNERNTNQETYSIPIYENGVKTKWTVDGLVGDEKYFKLLELGNGIYLPNIINTTTKK